MILRITQDSVFTLSAALKPIHTLRINFSLVVADMCIDPLVRLFPIDVAGVLSCFLNIILYADFGVLPFSTEKVLRTEKYVPRRMDLEDYLGTEIARLNDS